MKMVSNLAWKPPDGMEEYLKPTEFVDSNSEIVIEATKRVIQDAKTPRQAAIKIFYYVREEIKFGFVYPPLIKASSVIKRAMGQCTAKTILTVAMLRAAKIPARFHFADISTESIRGLASRLTYRVMPEAIGHAYPEVYLDRWIKIEPLIDKELYEVMTKKKISLGAPDLPKPSIDWDGYSDALVTGSLLAGDFGVHASPEAELTKVIRRFSFKEATRRFVSLRGVLWSLLGGWWLSNRNLEKLRKE